MAEPRRHGVVLGKIAVGKRTQRRRPDHRIVAGAAKVTSAGQLNGCVRGVDRPGRDRPRRDRPGRDRPILTSPERRSAGFQLPG